MGMCVVRAGLAGARHSTKLARIARPQVMSTESVYAPQRRSVVVDGLVTSYLEAGEGEPVVLLHGGEFGADAQLAWERNVAALATRHRVVAPDLLGFGQSAKVVDFVDGRGMRIRHVARFCAVLGIDEACFVGNSMGAVMLLVDAVSPRPVIPARKIAALCGGGEILQNTHVDALYEYDGSVPAMRRLVEALFHDSSFPADDEYVRRRQESSLVPGAWEAVAAARFRRPGAQSAAQQRNAPPYERVAVPALLAEGEKDKLKPVGWAAEIAQQIPGGSSSLVEGAGHCPQIEQPDIVNDLLLDFCAS